MWLCWSQDQAISPWQKPLVYGSHFECNTSFKTYFYGADQLFHLDKVFYAGLAYFILFVLVYAMGRVIGLFIPLIPTPEKWEEYPFQIASGVLAVLVTYFVLQMGFTILSTIPMAAIQDRLHWKFPHSIYGAV